MKIMGFDESGRGSLLGSLIIGWAIIDIDNTSDLKKIGVRDAKSLTRSDRDKIMQYVFDYKIEHGIREIPASDINTGANLNLMETLNITDEIRKHKDVKKFYIDAYVPLKGIPKLHSDYLYILNFNKKRKVNYDITLANKAETKYLVVALASIVARYYWDLHIDNIRKDVFNKYGILNIGNCYTPDHKTLRFIRDYSDYPEVRRVFTLTGKNWEKILNE